MLPTHSYMGEKDPDKLYPVAMIGFTDTPYPSVRAALSNPPVKYKMLKSFTDYAQLALKGKCFGGMPHKVLSCITDYPKVIVENDYHNEYTKMHEAVQSIGQLKLPFPMITLISGEKTEHDSNGNLRLPKDNLLHTHGVVQDGEVNLLFPCFLTQEGDLISVNILFTKPDQVGKSYHVITAYLGMEDGEIMTYIEPNDKIINFQEMLDSITAITIVAIYKLTISGGDMYISAPTPEEAAVNRRRISSNKKPLIEFKLITVDEKKQEVRSLPQGTHASPRQHWRRGHWRTAPKSGKKVWIEPMLVGDEANGKVIKDYAIGHYEKEHVHH